MALIIKKDGRIFCAALNPKEDSDIYLDDAIHYYLSVIKKILVTTKNEYHMANGGEWWYKGEEPKELEMDNFYYE